MPDRDEALTMDLCERTILAAIRKCYDQYSQDPQIVAEATHRAFRSTFGTNIPSARK